MARKPRVKSTTGIYHVLVRASADISLFTDEEDVTIYTNALKDLQDKGYCTVYAYSLFDTHLHLLIKTSAEQADNSSLLTPDSSLDSIGSVMKRLANIYSYYFNVKYDHYGPIYQDRYKSEPIEDLTTFVQCLNFVSGQQTEWRAVMTPTIPSLPNHSSSNHSSLIPNHSSFLDYEQRRPRITDSRLLTFLKDQHHFTSAEELLARSADAQRHVIASCKTVGGNALQISRLTGMPRKKVMSIL